MASRFDPRLEVDVAQACAFASGTSPLPSEVVDLHAAAQRVLAHDVAAGAELPTHDASVMDGYAVRSHDVLAHRGLLELEIVGESAAGHGFTGRVAAGQAVRIATGAMVPMDTDAVIAQEDATREGDVVQIHTTRLRGFERGMFVRKAGSEVQRGQVVLTAGTSLGGPELALLAAVGHRTLSVHRRPRVAILGTGDELVPLGTSPKLGQIVDTNGLMLAVLVREALGCPLEPRRVGDEQARLRAALRSAVHEADVVLTTGGISVGDHDLVFDEFLALGFRPFCRRVRLRPGRPTTLGHIGACAIAALPGNPASAFVAFELFVRPLLLRLQGITHDVWRHEETVVTETSLERAGARTHCVRARVERGRATALPSQASGDLRSLGGTNALLVLDPGTDPILPGTRVRAHVMTPGICS